MRIGELARRTGLSIATIRFYEKRGLLGDKQVTRSENGYRCFDDSSIEQIQLIRHAQLLGFTLTQIAQWVKESKGEPFTRDGVFTVLTHQLAEIEKKIAQLEETRNSIARKLSKLDRINWATLTSVLNQG